MPLHRSQYRDGQALTAAALTDDAVARDAALCWSQRAAHCPGVVGGLWLALSGSPLEVKVSPGAALDGQGRLLLSQVELSTPWPATATGPQGVWLQHREQRIMKTAAQFARCDETPQLVLAPIGEPAEAYRAGEAVFLGTIGLRSEDRECQGRTYVGAVGARIESASGRSRVLLGPDRPGDTRRFAVGVRGAAANEDEPVDVLTWEATGNIVWRTTASVSSPIAASHPATDALPAPAVFIVRVPRAASSTDEVIDSDAASEPTLAPPPAKGVWFKNSRPAAPERASGTVRLVHFEQNGRLVHELRISIADPGEKNHPERYRCSLGAAAKVPASELRTPIRQTAQPYGILSVLADRSVEIMGNLNVFAGAGASAPGLILAPEAQAEAAASQAPFPQPILYDAVRWENVQFDPLPATAARPEQILLRGSLRNMTVFDISPLTLFVTVYSPQDASRRLKQVSHAARQPLTANTSATFDTLFGTVAAPIGEFGSTTIVINALLLGAAQNKAIIQTQLQFERPPSK